MSASATTIHTVLGMSCEHCRRAVEDEVGAVAGVDAVEVDLASGRLTISGAGVDDEDVRAAVVAAGYELLPLDSAAGVSDPDGRS